MCTLDGKVRHRNEVCWRRYGPAQAVTKALTLLMVASGVCPGATVSLWLRPATELDRKRSCALWQIAKSSKSGRQLQVMLCSGQIAPLVKSVELENIPALEIWFLPDLHRNCNKFHTILAPADPLLPPFFETDPVLGRKPHKKSIQGIIKRKMHNVILRCSLNWIPKT